MKKNCAFCLVKLLHQVLGQFDILKPTERWSYNNLKPAKNNRLKWAQYTMSRRADTYGTNHGLFRQFHIFKTVAKVNTVADSQNICKRLTYSETA